MYGGSGILPSRGGSANGPRPSQTPPVSLTPGTRIGPYEIQSAIGAGGMGEVYRARDTKLNRDVAIKVLPELFAADPEPRRSSPSPCCTPRRAPRSHARSGWGGSPSLNWSSLWLNSICCSTK